MFSKGRSIFSKTSPLAAADSNNNTTAPVRSADGTASRRLSVKDLLPTRANLRNSRHSLSLPLSVPIRTKSQQQQQQQDADDGTVANGEHKLRSLLAEKTSGSLLDLSHTKLVETDMEILAAFLREHSTVTSISMENCEIDDEAIEGLASCILEQNTTLRALDLSSNEITDAGVVTITKALSKNQHSGIRAVYLSGNDISSLGAVRIAQFLEIRDTKRRDSIASTTVTIPATATAKVTVHTAAAAGGGGGGGATTDHNNLEEIDLSRNRIDDAGAVALAKAIETNASLTRLDLSSNAIDLNGINALAQCLAKNSTLKELVVTSNRAGTAGVETIKKAFQNKISSASAIEDTTQANSNNNNNNSDRICQLEARIYELEQLGVQNDKTVKELKHRIGEAAKFIEEQERYIADLQKHISLLEKYYNEKLEKAAAATTATTTATSSKTFGISLGGSANVKSASASAAAREEELMRQVEELKAKLIASDRQAQQYKDEAQRQAQIRAAESLAAANASLQAAAGTSSAPNAIISMLKKENTILLSQVHELKQQLAAATFAREALPKQGRV